MRAALTVAAQNAKIRKHFPTFRQVMDADFMGVWEGTLTPICQPYRVRLVYFCRRTFKYCMIVNPAIAVTVLDPKVGPNMRGTGERTPHIYALNAPPDSPRLCLYDPGDWYPHEAIADTILPWTIDWLFFYEGWLATG